MTFKVIVPVTGTRDEFGARDFLIEQCALDFTDVLELALDLWDELDTGDHDTLRTALEVPLHRKLPRRKRLNFDEFTMAITALAAATGHFHNHLQRLFAPIFEYHVPNGRARLRLLGFVGDSAIIEFRLRS